MLWYDCWSGGDRGDEVAGSILLLNEITDMQGMLSETMVAESYIQGFRDCAELIIDVMFGRSENLK